MHSNYVLCFVVSCGIISNIKYLLTTGNDEWPIKTVFYRRLYACAHIVSIHYVKGFINILFIITIRRAEVMFVV